MEKLTQMKVLLVNTSDKVGGAARAAFRLHQALLNGGLDSQMLVQNKVSDEHTVISESNKIRKNLNKYKPLIDAIPLKLYKQKSATVFSVSWLSGNRIVKKINSLKPDIVHLHWICNGMLRIEDIPKIEAPIIWSLHDMWAFTGGCNYDEQCGGYQSNCGKCKVLGSNKENDLSKFNYNRKNKAYEKKKDITIVGLSNWLKESSESSSLLSDKRHINFPNLIDTNVYKPCDRDYSRALWNLPLDKKLILFGAMSATTDPRKGFQELSQALLQLNIPDVELVVFGGSKQKNAPDLKFKVNYISNLSDDESLVTLYSAVDVMIVPSLQENLSNAIMESLSCGTPVVGFDIGGNSDMIDHKETGYLAQQLNTTDLKDGIEWVLKNDNYTGLRENARNKVLKNFDSRVVAEKYIKLYRETVRKRKGYSNINT